MKNIKVSFLERDFFAEDWTKTTVRGYEPAVIDSGKGIVYGRVIIPEELKKANFIDTTCFQTQFPLCDNEIDLVPILENDENGNNWLQKHKTYHSQTYGIDIPMIFSIQLLDSVPGWTYHLMPKDYFARTEGGRKYQPPKAVMDNLPEGTFYCRIHPPVKFSNGKWITNLYYNRKVRGSKGIFDSYHISDPNDTNHFQVAGVLFGELNQADLKNLSGDFEKDFPLDHFLEVCYPISLRQAGKFNPLTIKVELAN